MPQTSKIIALWFGILLVGFAVHFPVALNHDAAWHFYTSFRFVAGDRIGIDIFDVNPPMAMWLFTPVALLAQLTAVDPGTLFKGVVFLICTAVWFAARSITSRMRGPDHRCWADTVVMGGALIILPGYDFGQREHIAAMLTLPYALLAAGRLADAPVSRAVAIAVGVAAGVGIGFKPHFLAVFLMVELWLMARRGTVRPLLRPESIAIVAVGVVYVAMVVLIAPDYLTVVVPAAIANYGGFERPWEIIAKLALSALLLPSLIVALAAAGVVDRRNRLFAEAAVAAGAGFLIAAALQQKGWAYQFYPVQMFLVVAAGFLLADRGDSGISRKIGFTALILVMLTKSVSFVADGHAVNGTTARVAALTQLFSSACPADAPVYALITSPRDVHPALLASGRNWASASGALVYLPALVDTLAQPDDSGAAGRIAEVADDHTRQVLRDIQRSKPPVILVDAGREKLGLEGQDFEYLSFMAARYEHFSEIWSAYRERPPIGKFRVFVRRNAVCGTIGRASENI